MDLSDFDGHRPNAQDILSNLGFSPLNYISTPSCDSVNYGFGLQHHQVAGAEGDTPPIEQKTSAELMEPPAPRRKPKARTLRG
jgi:hypothetical protein